MGIEIERKFLVTSEGWRSNHQFYIHQGYLSLDPNRIVRLRILDQKAFITIKSQQQGISRLEFEYEIPKEDAEKMMHLCLGGTIEKYRHYTQQGDLTWEVDEFLGDNAGLVVAEIELSSEHQQFALPDWIGREVTKEPRYLNSNLIEFPFAQWHKTST